MTLEFVAPVSFKAESLADIPAHQRLIARSLRNWYQAIAAQAVPEQMLDLLRQAEARGRLAVRSSSLTAAMMIVGALVALLVFYDVAWLALTQPAIGATIALVAALAAIGGGMVWLIEDK